MGRFVKNTLFMLLLVYVCPVYAQPTGNTRLKFAVYVTGIKEGRPLTDVDEEMNSAHGVASDVMINSGKYEMIERSQAFLKQIREEQKYQHSGVVEDKQIAAIGKANGAQKICVVQLTIKGNGLLVVARIVDVENETASQSGRVQKSDYSSWLDVGTAVEEAVNKIIGNSAVPQTANRSVTTYNPDNDLNFKVGDVTFKMIFVKGGTFQMGGYSGDDDEKPAHTVSVSDFYIGEFEVTQALWQEVMGTTIDQQQEKANTSWPDRGVGANYPMYYVSHTEAEEFCGHLNQRLRGDMPAGYIFALPTEAEWEYAALGGNKSNSFTYSGSNCLLDVGWNTENGTSTTHPVGLKKANELGLYDMSGNVYEWCSDWYGSYGNFSQKDPQGPSSGSYRVRRGGSWNGNASFCRVTARNSNSPSSRNGNGGFRLSLVHRKGIRHDNSKRKRVDKALSTENQTRKKDEPTKEARSRQSSEKK